MQSVYIETTIPSYLRGRPSKHLIVAKNQAETRRWWESERKHYRLFTSDFTVDEASSGDPTAARGRLESLAGIKEWDIPERFERLERNIIELSVNRVYYR